jgi:hypothetical protein
MRFEYFREDLVPECESAEAQPDIFNSANDFELPPEQTPGELVEDDLENSAEDDGDEEPLF